MNFGSWNVQTMAEKLGDLWKLSWRTSILRMIRLHFAPQPINGDSTTRFQLFRHLPLWHHFFRFYHIPNIRMYILDNRFRLFLIRFIFSNRAGDAQLNITHKAHLHHFIGHLGDLHHHLRHLNPSAEPLLLLRQRRLRVNHMDKYHTNNLVLWICQIPVCKDSPQFATQRKNDTTSLSNICSGHLGCILVTYFSFFFENTAALALFVSSRRHGPIFISPSSISSHFGR